MTNFILTNVRKRAHEKETVTAAVRCETQVGIRGQ